MKRLIRLFFLLSVLAGCQAPNEPEPISWGQQQRFLGKVYDPRVFGLSMVQTSDGVRIQGGGRLHQSQSDALEMLLDEPLRPVVNMKGRVQQEWPILLDLTVKNSVFEFDTARAITARPITEGRPTLVDVPGDPVKGCLSLIPTLRLGQVFVESQMVLVRMANGLPDSVCRGIDKPGLTGVVGWDVLRKMGQIQFIYSLGQVVLRSTEIYEPNPYETLAMIPLASNMRVCAVNGAIDGVAVPILIDPAGDFEVATPQGQPISTLQLAAGFSFSNPSVSVSPDGVRLGARFLERFRVTVCPKQRVIYFEKRASID